VALLSIEGVRKDFLARGKRVLAVEKVDLTIEEGEFVTVVGPSGCGKSTLLNLCVGLLRASSGQILFRGIPIDGICTKIGYVTQKDNLLPWRTLAELVAGQKPGRCDDEAITLFDSSGLGLQDVASAAAIYRRALDRGVGQRLPFN